MDRMRTIPWRIQRSEALGFTLLELVIAMTCSALLVALLVSVWIQVMRTSTSAMAEVAVLRQRETQRREIQKVLFGLRWNALSLAPQGGLSWGETQGRLWLWSGESFGKSPGPVQWTFEVAPEGPRIRLWDSLAANSVLHSPDWTEIQGLRLETLANEVREYGEEVRWISLSQWDVAKPFRPLGFRLWVRWKGQDTEECIVRTL